MIDAAKFDPFKAAHTRYRELRRSKWTKDGYSRWLLLIKQLRALHQISILEAERMALSNRHMHRWVERQINTQQRCRKYALAHIRANGDAALIDRDGDTFRFSIRKSLVG